MTPFFLIVTTIAIFVVIYMFLSSEKDQNLFRLSLSLILGGAFGNLCDRAHLGYVIDFIDWHYYNAHWPTFNVADSAISIGLVFLIIDMYLDTKKKKSN